MLIKSYSGNNCDVSQYDRTVIAFSGGKDSLACVLWALKVGCPNIELWHHDVDGNSDNFMDWPVTPAYCRAIAKALNLPIYFSWLEGGFEREMNRNDQPKAPTWFEAPEGDLRKVGGKGRNNTRLKFPQVSANLSVRWCSAYLKVDCYAAALRNQKRFNNSKTLVITGERAEESSSRSKYLSFEPDRTDNRNGRTGRLVDRLRPVHGWAEADVWAIIGEFCINPHPAYQLGWARLSCLTCIFGSASQWATIKAIAPATFEKIATYEETFGVTIKRKLSVRELANRGTPYPSALTNPALVKIALSEVYDHPAILTSGTWTIPAGAYGEAVGPS